MTKIVFPVFLLVVVLVGLLLAFAPVLSPIHDPQIAFENYQGRNGEIYLLDMATGISLNLTHNQRDDGHPAWSPDGRRIAFASNRTDNIEIFVMNADGSNVYNLSRHLSDDSEPTWSPDGRQIAFISRREGNSEIYIMDVAAILVDPTCAALPDTFLVNPSQACAPLVRRLTNSDENEASPVWSPDGRRIVFVQETDQDSEIYIMSVQCDLPEGCPSDRYNLSDDLARDRFPAWSPDGRRIAFSSQRSGVWDVYTMNADGSQIRRLTNGTGAFTFPSWSPDGQQIIFAGRQDGKWAMYMIHAQCQNLPEGCADNMRRITHNGNEDFRPVWRP
jgi:TolB protein